MGRNINLLSYDVCNFNFQWYGYIGFRSIPLPTDGDKYVYNHSGFLWYEYGVDDFLEDSECAATKSEFLYSENTNSRL